MGSRSVRVLICCLGIGISFVIAIAKDPGTGEAETGSDTPELQRPLRGHGAGLGILFLGEPRRIAGAVEPARARRAGGIAHALRKLRHLCREAGEIAEMLDADRKKEMGAAIRLRRIAVERANRIAHGAAGQSAAK